MYDIIVGCSENIKYPYAAENKNSIYRNAVNEDNIVCKEALKKQYITKLLLPPKKNNNTHCKVLGNFHKASD